MSSTVLSMFRNQAERQPEALCVVDDEGEHTYGQMDRDAKNMAAGLRKRGVCPGDRVLACCDARAHYLALELSCWLLGAVFVPVEEEASPARIRSIAEDAEPEVYVGSARIPEAAGLRTPVFSYEQLLAETAAGGEPFHDPAGSETAEILFTTGTTGKSKGVELTHENDAALAENVAEGVHMREGNIELIPLPLSHAHGIRTCYAAYLRGGCVILVNGVSQVRRIYELIRRYHATAIDLSPTAATVLLKLSKGKFSDFCGQLDYVEVGTAYLNDELKDSLRKTFPGVRLYNFYGSTESGRSCVLDFSGDEDRKHCIGKGAVHAEFAVADENRRFIRSDSRHLGLIACRGTMNMKGYWRQKELTDSVMRDGFVFTKDEGYIDDEGYVYVLGRADDVINFRGIKIAPDEIEEAASDYPGIRDCACVPMDDAMSGQIPVLAVDADETMFDHTAMMQYLRQHVDADKIPQKIVVSHNIPRSFNGKIQRKKLVEILLAEWK